MFYIRFFYWKFDLSTFLAYASWCNCFIICHQHSFSLTLVIRNEPYWHMLISLQRFYQMAKTRWHNCSLAANLIVHPNLLYLDSQWQDFGKMRLFFKKFSWNRLIWYQGNRDSKCTQLFLSIWDWKTTHKLKSYVSHFRKEVTEMKSF